MGQWLLRAEKSWEKDTQSPQQRRHPPQLHLTHAEQDNPNEVWRAVDTPSKLTAREAELLGGRRKNQEAKAANRKGTEIHNWADRAGEPEIPTPKGG